jgi:arylsulfatase A-like enzyme
VTERILDSHEKYNNKRLIVHYIQPHRPFLGDIASEVEQSGLVGNGVIRDKPTVDFWWTRLENGESDYETVWNAYAETLELTLPHIERLVKQLSGKTVVSADHGNAFGEDGIFGHPTCTHHESLVKVPWLVVENERKEIINSSADAPTHTDEDDDIGDRLAALGYLDA